MIIKTALLLLGLGVKRVKLTRFTGKGAYVLKDGRVLKQELIVCGGNQPMHSAAALDQGGLQSFFYSCERKVSAHELFIKSVGG